MRNAKHVKTQGDAALYVRVSTESQNYSTDHQRAKIRQYALRTGLRIVREYADEGRSGVGIKGRAGLQSLISDVQSGSADFSTIVVYDVSRWGRFQDLDEAAYYEHTCRRAGISVVYCEEQFQNDGSPLGTLLKAIKRTMAAEYSRELSQKVFDAQCRFVRMGFKQGGHAGFGLRRLAVEEDGKPRGLLTYGQAKGALTDRVVLVAGPPAEIAIVNRIYTSYTVERQSEAAIARTLNVDGIQSETGRHWTQSMVHSVLTNRKYRGELIYNRRSCKLSTRRTPNSVEDWVVNDNAIQAIVLPATFELAQKERERRNRKFTPEELLDLLRDCHVKHGRVTAPLIAAEASMPDPQLYVRTFGSLVTAYDMAGLPRTKWLRFVGTKALLARMRLALLNEILVLCQSTGVGVAASNIPDLLTIGKGLRVRIDVVPRRSPRRGQHTWKVSFHAEADFTIIARLCPISGELIDYFLLPLSAFGGRNLYLKDDGFAHLRGANFTKLNSIFGL